MISQRYNKDVNDGLILSNRNKGINSATNILCNTTEYCQKYDRITLSADNLKMRPFRLSARI